MRQVRHNQDINRVPQTNIMRYSFSNFIIEQLRAANTTPEVLDELGLIVQAGGGDLGPGKHTILSAYTIKQFTMFQEFPISIKMIIALRRLFDTPVDVMLNMEPYPVIYGGLPVVRVARRMDQKTICKIIQASTPMLYRIETFSAWAADNQAGKLITPAKWIWDKLEQTFGFGLIVQMREVLKANIDDILGLSYRD